MGIKKEKFGETASFGTVTKYILENQHGMKVALIDMGANITEIWVPDRNGKLEDVVLGFDTAEEYAVNGPSFGAVIGRYANRIAKASFTLNGKTYDLDDNDKSNCLHGGFFRFEHQKYEAECHEGLGECSVSFTRFSRDMEQGFPGNLTVTVTYTLNDENELMIEYYGVSDEDTVINMTNHSYFNIGSKGHAGKNVLNHTVQVDADAYTPVNEILIPTGELRPVDGTALDLRETTRIGAHIGEPTPDEKTIVGYDHNFVLRRKEGEIIHAVTYSDPESGRVMEVFTDAPGVQIYSATMLDPTKGKEGVTYNRFDGICFETQNYPDAVNQPNFPSAVLKAGEEYEHTAIFRFGVSDENRMED